MTFSKEDYVARISSANPVQLVVIQFELIVCYIDEAQVAYDQNINEYLTYIRKAQQGVDGLIVSLDLSRNESKGFLSLYIYVNKLLMTAYFRKNPEDLAEAKKIMSELLEGWVETEKNTINDWPAKDTRQQIYAGLTYKNGEIAEYIEEDADRGFKA